MKFLVAGLSAALLSTSLTAGSTLTFSTRQLPEAMRHFQALSKLVSPGRGEASVSCGYIFPGDSSKFGCTGTGRGAADVAAACAGGGQLACTGSGSNRTCTCAFD